MEGEEGEEAPPVVTGTPVGASATAVGKRVAERLGWKSSGVKNLEQKGEKWRARVRVDGKDNTCQARATRAEAEADLEEVKKEQRNGKVRRRQDQAGKEQEDRDAHAEHLAANQATYGGAADLDRLSRNLVALALHGTDVVCVPGVEYSKDLHLFRAEDDLGFDPALDVEPDDAVPTLVAELKASRQANPNHGKTDNPYTEFKHIDYAEERATIVLMLYIPDDVTEATPETLRKVKFWCKTAFGWKPKNGEFHPTLHGGNNAANRFLPGRLLGEKLCEKVHYRAGKEGGLLPYGARKRVFKSADHAKGQAVIDALEMQVLLPLGARFLTPVGGGEGGAEDVRIAFEDGTHAQCAGQAREVQQWPRRLSSGLAPQIRLHPQRRRHQDPAE